MKSILKAALCGAILASAVFFFHFLVPVLLLLLFFGLIRRALFGPHWNHVSYGARGPCGRGVQRTPTVDGRDWQRPSTADSQARDVPVH